MMGDSDEDHDTRGARRGRDKFRRERSDFSGDRQGRRDGWGGRRPPTDGGRELGNSAGQWERRKRDYSDRRGGGGGGGGGDRAGPRGESPPMKRRRRDWDAGGYGGDFGGGGGGPYGMGGGGGGQWGGPDMGGMGPDRRGSGGGGGGAGGGMGGGMPGQGMGMAMAGMGMGAAGGMGMAMPGGGGGGGGGAGGAAGEDEEAVYQQPMMTFKQWLSAQTDDVGEEDAVERYNTYKLDYKRTAIDKFFDAHKDEEWFKEKFHPVVKANRETVVRQQLRTRVNAFVDLLQSGRLDKVTLDSDQMDSIVKLLDSAMIKMDGGDDNDLRVLDRPATPPRERKKSKSSPSRSPERKKANKKVEGKTRKESTVDPPSPSSVPMPADPPPARREDADQAVQEAAEKAAKERQREEFLKKQEAFQQQQIAQMAEQMAAEQAKAKKEKRKHRRHHRDAYSYDTDESESEEDSEEDNSADEPAPPGVEPAAPGMEAATNGADVGAPGVDEPGVPGVSADPPMESEPLSASTATEAAAEAEAAEIEPAAAVAMDASDDAVPVTETAKPSDGSSEPETAEAVKAAPAEHSGDEGVCDMEDGEEATAHEEEPAAAVEAAQQILPEPRPLHQTRSLHIRNLPPSVTRAELEAIGKKTQGFLRSAVGEPNPEKKFQRRAWLTYEKNVNINEAHWSINTMKLKDHELNVITNRDVTNRVRNVSHLSLSRQAVTADIRFATKLIRHLDSKRRIFEPEPEPEANPSEEPTGDGEEVEGETVVEAKPELVKLTVAANPLLKSDGSAERTESSVSSSAAVSTSTGSTSSGGSSSSNGGAATGSTTTTTTTTTSSSTGAASDGEAAASDGEDGAARADKQLSSLPVGGMFKRDDKQLRVLDRLLFYLRLVHSLDYYQQSDMPDEHDMPHRCCVVHVRGPVMQTFKASLKDVTDYITTQEDRLSVFLKTRGEVSADEARQLGQKSSDDAVEKFVLENCKEVGKDKFLCPLSGKKFRGPEFVRKHIYNKHADSVQAVRDDVEFFNSFLRDPDRPHVPLASSSAAPPVRARLGRAGPGPMGPGGHPGGMQGGPNPGFDYPPEGMYGGGGPGPGGFMGGWGGPRPHVMGYNPPFMPGMFGFGPPMEMFGRPPFPPGGPRGRGRRDRRLMDYRDLDQPEDVDF